jgi:hypothetical protein
LEIGGAGKDSVILDGGGAFSIAGRFLLQINTTNTIQLARGRDAEGNVFDADNKPIMVELTPQSLRIAGKAEVKVGPISLMGAVDFLINDRGVQLAMQVVLDMSAFGKIQVKGAAAIGIDAADKPFFALYLNFSTEMNIAILKIKAEASLRINTSSLDYTTLQGDVIKANTMFDLELRGVIDIFLFDVEFYGRMSVIDSVFKLEFEGKLNFFNITTVEIAGYVDSEGNFEFRGKIEIDIYMGPLHLNAGASLLLSSKPRFAAAVWGSLDIEIKIGFINIDFTLAGFRGEIDITPASGYLAARVTVMGISISGSYLWSWTDPPRVSHMEGETLVLNLGDAAGRYGPADYDEIVNEGTGVEYDGQRDEYVVRSLGQEERFSRSRVKAIRGHGGAGNDSIYIGQGVDAVLDLQGGEGRDSFLIQGGRSSGMVDGQMRYSMVSGDAGDDEFMSGSSEFIRYFGDDRPANGALSWTGTYTGSSGNDRFTGAAAAVVVDMGRGNDTVVTGPKADSVILRGGNSRVNTGEGGDTIWLDSNYGETTLSVTGGTGTDLLRISPFASTAAITLGAMSLEHAAPTGYLTVNFNDQLDRIEMSDTATSTLLKTVAMDWKSTDLSLQASGSVDVSTANFKAADEIGRAHV